MTLLNTLTRKTAKVRMERKLTVSKTKVFVPKLVGTKICLSALSSASTLVPRWKIPPPPPSILACHLVLKHFCRWSWLTDLGWLYNEKVALMFDHSHSITSSADVPSPSFPPKPHLPPHLSSFFCVSTHFPSQFTLDAFWSLQSIILSIRTNSMLTFDTHMQQRLSDPSRLLMVGIANFQKGPTDYLFSYKKCFVCSQAWHITQSYSLQIQAGNDVHSKQW